MATEAATPVSVEGNTLERDVFREPPLRYLGYANEVGEAFRHTVPLRVVHLTYLLASGYVVAHAVTRGQQWSSKTSTHDTPTQVVVDTLVWQGLASVVIPGVTINRICALGRWGLTRWGTRSPYIQKWAVIGIGLSAIPFVIKPIDRLVDHQMDLLRPFAKKWLTRS